MNDRTFVTLEALAKRHGISYGAMHTRLKLRGLKPDGLVGRKHGYDAELAEKALSLPTMAAREMVMRHYLESPR